MKQWYDILCNLLELNDIPYERTTLCLDNKILKIKDGDWSSKVVDGQLVKVIYKSTHLLIQGRTKDDLKFTLGKVDFDTLESDEEFNLGIVGWLKDSENYHGKRSLNPEQHIVLIKASSIPDEIIKNRTLKIRLKPNEINSSGCIDIFTILFVLAIFSFVIWLIFV